MRSLVFSLIHDCSRRAGCGDEAWDIITEFAAAEALLDRLLDDRNDRPESDCAHGEGFILAAEALLSCLGHPPQADEWADELENESELGFEGSPSIAPRTN